MAKNTVVKKRSFFGKALIFRSLFALAFIAVAAFGVFYYDKYNDLKNSSPEQLQQAQTDSYIAAINRLYALPTDEKPDIATVKDKEALKKQYPFFDQAENDDIVLIYKNAKLAILYRPSSKQLIKVGPVNVESGLSIRTVGNETERKAVEKLLGDSQVSYTSGGNAKTAITGVTVVDVSGKHSEDAKKLAEVVKGKVGSLPAGEEKPDNVDLLVLVGPAAAETSVTPTP